MSFIIKSDASSAFAARGLQERHAHDRRTEHRPNLASRHQGPLSDSCDLTNSGKSAAAIREAGIFKHASTSHSPFSKRRTPHSDKSRTCL